jgi:RNA polymerase sigma factor (sigma-70 family)
MTEQPPTSDPSNAREAAFERLYARHHRAVLAYCARRASLTDAWDATADVFLVAWRRMEDMPSREGQLPWLIGVAARTLANQRRAHARNRRREQALRDRQEGPGPHPDEVVIRREEETEVLDALARLRHIDREIIQLSYWEELPPVDIARILGISRDAVDQRSSRAKRRLAGELNRRSIGLGPGRLSEGSTR